MSEIYWWIPFGINILLYGICCLLILKRKNYTLISIRSPTLLLMTIIGNFLMSLVILLFKITGQNFFSSFYYLFRVMMIVSLFLRYERIILCCGIKRNDQYDKRFFYKKRKMYIEKFYMRIFVLFFIIFLVATIVVRVLKFDYFEIFFTNKNQKLNEIKIWIFTIWNFVEQFIMVTYLFRMYDIINPGQLITFELFSFLIIWFIYSNFTFLFAYINKNNMFNGNCNKNNIFIFASLAVNYICLIINGYLPIITSFVSKALLAYHFTDKLMNNLYLFLTNEACYESFNDYLLEKKRENRNENGPFFLKLYTYIMKFKLFFDLNANNRELGFAEANRINNTFFEDETNVRFIDPVIVTKVKAECKDLNNNVLNKNMFDDALEYVYNELNKKFGEYKVSREYNELQAKISLTSYIRCKMCNVGLINKF